ncbi:PhnD/SsuA/transferrin family substrate-binding protein [Desulfitibacter alkalitolerans]|uniref:PhnD/SsuA/transferrin family substrate-binding protein n=1 Tax=Desulfitibacter alkalitolerans TaxID=264641 RepID=UPI000489EF1C|nr:PhnD/SsuA/transferrin family substrate-binding protein [Desulfitibacter alkalitolerans]
MKKVFLLIMTFMLIGTLFAAGCTTAGGTVKEDGPLVMVWYPNESGEDLKGARDEIGSVIEKATGRKIEHKLTTDYVIAIESIANGNAHLAFMGAAGYIEANKRNSKVLPLVVNSGASGTLDDAVYYSWLAVKKENEGMYKAGQGYSIDSIAGKRFSFVSTNSTSGFRVPAAGITNYFSKKSEWKSLTQEDLLEGGQGKLFNEVLYGGSHQGAAVNLLTNKADVASFCDVCVGNYVEIVAGEHNRPGATYKISQDAVDPFTNLRGQEFVVIDSTPVLNAPFAVNTEVVSQEQIKAILDALTNEETTKNEKIFVPKDSQFKGLWKQGERFLLVEDSWFNPIRELSK